MIPVIGERLREVFYFFRANLWALLLVTLPFGAITALVVHLFGEPLLMVNEQPRVEWKGAVLLTLLQPLALGMKVVAIHRLAGGLPLALGEVLRESLRLWPVLAAISVLMGLAVGVGLLVLFVIPGAWLYARLGYAPIIAVTESRGALEALAESWQRSRAQQFELFMLTLVLGAVLVAVMVALFGIVAHVDASATFGADLAARGINELLFCLLTISFYRYWSLSRQDA